MSEPALVFSHANGFPAPTYRTLFDVWRQAGYAVHAPGKFGHDPRYPVTSNWPHLGDELLDFIERETAGPLFLVGHSLGGFLSLLAASRSPARIRGVVLLDSPIIAGWRAHSLHMAKASGLIERIAPSKVARRRRHEWPDLDAVHAHFASRAAFARWHPQVLADYAQHGTVPAPAGRALGFERAIETRIYETLPHQLPQVLRRHPLRAPVAFIGGTRSAELRQAGMAATVRLAQGRVSSIEGSHLFPFERPVETAHEVMRWLAQLDRLAPSAQP